MDRSKNGFTAVEALIIVVVLGAIGFVGYTVFNKQKDKSVDSSQVATGSGSEKNGPVKWAYNQNAMEWFVQSGTAPKCKEPFKFDRTPIDISQATSVMWPGAYRGFSYKPHGGFRADKSPNGHITVKMPIDATLTGITRYYEGAGDNPDELQYLLSFESDCGIAFRFDHLHTLAPKFQAFAEKTPKPKKDDTSSNPDDQPDPVFFKSGEVVATVIGFPKSNNFGFDFGVYDYRERNNISKNSKWAKIHNMHTATEWHAVCWFDMLPGSDAAKAKQLSEVTINPSKPNLKISDHCENAKYNTLDFNDGKPIDG